MIYNLTSARMPVIAFIGIVFAFALTCFAIAKLNQYLPKDMGRQFAHDGKLSAGMADNFLPMDSCRSSMVPPSILQTMGTPNEVINSFISLPPVL